MVERLQSEGHQVEQEPMIIIKRSTEAPSEVKANPFYDAEIWGRAQTPEEVYLPESDEAISFALAAHEIGHLVKEGERIDASLDNYEATRAEEERAWQKGWPYMARYLTEYYTDHPEAASEIIEKYGAIRELMMKTVEISRSMYLPEGSLDGLTSEEQEFKLRQQREKFMAEHGSEIMDIFTEIKSNKSGQLVNWERYVAVTKKAIADIIQDNERIKEA
ncbi:MAG TPA: hypothetical protein DDW92_01930 [Candidatus Veblenbacteria bacterium]|nr:MAG: hypothetical protein UW00_C0019G0011 [Parcubacteria group bacterium GW2011_GWB1_43_66]HBH16999.1 hypothetical protein [Candidatus Veblenbacteria bacterium]